ncbi:MAG: transporter substrate-binding domain-containing protein [Chloroflexi bacterium]|nr:transporter substrate-binding domain-containing protein [Chloroflexota bacterium]
MKKQFALFIFLPLLYFAIFGAFVAADDLKIVRVGIYENQPKIFTDDQGKAAGFWPDIIEYIASTEGWRIEYKRGTWSECLKRLENNEIDIMPDVAFTEERNRTYAFSHEAVYSSWSRVYARTGTEIQSILDLDGKKIAVLQGSVNAEGPEGIKELVKSYNISSTFIDAASYARVFELVANGEADAGVVSKDFGYQHETEYKIVKSNVIFQPSLLYFAFPKNSSLTPYLIERIDLYIRTLKQDNNSIYYRSLDKWLGAKSAEKSVIPVWLIWSLIGIGGLALLLGAGSLILRSQVRSRTQALTAEINSRNRAEVELATYRDHLEKLVEERTAELAEKNIELSQSNIRLQEMDRLKSVFLASMSHELRTPLNSIIGFTGVMLQGIAGEINDEQRKQLSIVKSSATHLLSLISDVLDISKIEAGKAELFPEEFKLNDVMQDVVQTFSHMAGDKGLNLEMEVPENIVIYNDKRRVKQVLMNLISNAIKFTDNGSVKIAAGIPAEGNVEIRVSDTGTGIKEEDMGRLFEPFQQVDALLTKRHEGTGLGLYLTRKLVDLMSGNISAESTYGRGSEFKLTIPLRYQDKVNPPSPAGKNTG